jgi:hypothetical protein
LLKGESLPPSAFLRYCPESGRWAFFQWLLQAKSVAGSVADTERKLAHLRQQWSAKKQQLLAELQSQRQQVWQQLERRQREDLRECWSHVQRGMASVPGVLPLEVWVLYGPELSQRYLGWEEPQVLTIAEEIWHPPLVPVLRGHAGLVNSVAVTPDGRHIVSGSVDDDRVRLWQLATGNEVRRFTVHASWVISVAVTPDGKYVVSGSGDKTVRLWQLATGQEKCGGSRGTSALGQERRGEARWQIRRFGKP